MFGLSRSAYYQWLQQVHTNTADEKEKDMEDRIIHIFQEHSYCYGVRRIVAELQANDIEVGTYQVRKVLKK